MAVRKKYRIEASSIKSSSSKVKKTRTVGTRGKLFNSSRTKSVYNKRAGFGVWLVSLFTAMLSIFKGRGQGRNSRQRKTTKLRWLLSGLLKFVVVASIAGFLLVAGVFIYYSKDIPDPNKIKDRSVDQSTKIFDRTGDVLLYEIHGNEKRTLVKLADISPYLIKAVVSTEDKRFYSHIGVDLKGVVRSLYKDIMAGGKVQGGSTITQQFIKNSVLTPEKKLSRKIKEIILALETEQKFSKDEIMEMYLNQIPYGSNLYGVEVASQTFFGKSAKDLDIAESAMLAAIPKAPTRYFPYGSHPDELETRRKFVIDHMLSDGVISAEEAEDAKNVDMATRLKPFRAEIKAPHFVMYVKQQLVDIYGEEMVEKGGLRVYTTLDYDLQVMAEEVVKKGVEYNTQKYNATNASLVAIDPKTGYILSMVGGKDYFNIKEEGNVNVALSENRQPGSSFKPFVYATAFKKGYTADTILFDVPTNFGPDGSGKDFKPKNYNLQYAGPISMRNALARSLNIPAVKALYLAGIEDSLQTARDLGITTLKRNNYGLSVVLGTSGARLLDMTAAYGVFANDGYRNMAVGIIKIEDVSGQLLLQNNVQPKQVLSEQVARNINSILSDNVARTPAFGARSKLFFPERQVAAKTGTTSDYKDAWTIGYTPSIVVGVWAGNNSGKEMTRGGGFSAATPIWNEFLTNYFKNKESELFIQPESNTASKVMLNGESKNKITVVLDQACNNKLASDRTPEYQKEIRDYFEVHNILYYVNKDDPLGEIPEKPDLDPQFNRWEEGVVEWVQNNMTALVNQSIPTEICDLRNDSNAPVVDIVSPRSNQMIYNGYLNFEVKAYSFFNIKQVEFYFEDTLLKVVQNSPYVGSFRVTGDVESGVHTVRVRVYDNIGNFTDKEVTVIVNNNNTSVYLKPIVSNDFPVVLEAVASLNEADLKSIAFYYQLDSIYDADMNLVKKLGAEYKIGEVNYMVPDTNGLYQILWDEDRQYFISGKYKIYSIATLSNGQQYTSNARYIEIN